MGQGEIELDIRQILHSHQAEVAAKGFCRPLKEGLFRAVLKAAFVRLFEYAGFVHKEMSAANADGFFAAAPLRQCCEDLIALKFLCELSRKDRDTVIQSLMLISTSVAGEKQSVFFKRNHPFQSVLPSPWKADDIEKQRDRLTEIGTRTNLWHTTRKLPPIEQMARKVGLTELYEFLYAATSEIVHFNVRIGLRSGWGNSEKPEFNFSAANFSPYYLMFARTYSLYLLVRFSRTFRKTLTLSPGFMNMIDEVEVHLENQIRWPEIVTFEEMNVKLNENIIFRALSVVMRQERVEALRQKHRRKKKAQQSRLTLSSQ